MSSTFLLENLWEIEGIKALSRIVDTSLEANAYRRLIASVMAS